MAQFPFLPVPPILLAAALLLGGAGPAAALPQGPSAAEAPAFPPRTHAVAAGPILLRGSRALLDLVHELEVRSPSAAYMLRTLRSRGVPVTFGTFEELEPVVRATFSRYDPARSRAVGYMAPRARAEFGRDELVTEEILVALNLTRLDDFFADARRYPVGSAGEWDRIQRLETLALLGHEIVHAWGLVETGGDPRFGCADPGDAESPETACVVVGENLIRRELGAPLDWGYGLPSPESLARRYQALVARDAALAEITRQNTEWSRRFRASASSGIPPAGTFALLSLGR